MLFEVTIFHHTYALDDILNTLSQFDVCDQLLKYLIFQGVRNYQELQIPRNQIDPDD